MSGGAFGYVHGQIQDFADDLENRLNGDIGWINDSRTHVNLRIVHLLSKRLSNIIRLTDLFYSGDISEQTFNDQFFYLTHE